MNNYRSPKEWYFLKMAFLVSERGTCARRKVGCVLVNSKNHVLATGYNGVPSMITHCSVRGCIRAENNVPSGTRHELCWGLHGEQNVITQCALHGISTKSSVLYTTTFPCSICAKLIISAKIDCIIYLEDYNDDMSKMLLKEATVDVIKYE